MRKQCKLVTDIHIHKKDQHRTNMILKDETRKEVN